MEQIYEDKIEENIIEYIQEYGNDPEWERVERGRLLDPDFDRKEAEAFKKSLFNIEIVNPDE